MIVKIKKNLLVAPPLALFDPHQDLWEEEKEILGGIRRNPPSVKFQWGHFYSPPPYLGDKRLFEKEERNLNSWQVKMFWTNVSLANLSPKEKLITVA